MPPPKTKVPTAPKKKTEKTCDKPNKFFIKPTTEKSPEDTDAEEDDYNEATENLDKPENMKINNAILKSLEKLTNIMIENNENTKKNNTK